MLYHPESSIRKVRLDLLASLSTKQAICMYPEVHLQHKVLRAMHGLNNELHYSTYYLASYLQMVLYYLGLWCGLSSIKMTEIKGNHNWCFSLNKRLAKSRSVLPLPRGEDIRAESESSENSMNWLCLLVLAAGMHHVLHKGMHFIEKNGA